MSDTVSNERLRAILAGCEGVTPGPWKVDRGGLNVAPFNVISPQGEAELGTYSVARGVWWETNATFIAACDPDTIRSLVSELLAAREALKPFAWLTADGELLFAEGAPIRAMLDAIPEPPVGRKLLPLYARVSPPADEDKL